MNTAIISENGYGNTWAKDYVAVYTNRNKKPQQVAMGGTAVMQFVAPRHNVLMPGSPGADTVIAMVQKAVNLAGPNGTLVFNVGHGVVSASNTGTDGWVDLAPGGTFKLGGLNTKDSYVNVFYDMAIPRPGVNMKPKSDLDNDKDFNPGSDKLKRWAKYEKLCKIIKNGKLKKVVFLTCNIGNALDFLRKISIDFDTVCEAYKHKVQLTPQSNNKMRVHLKTDPVGVRTNIPDNEQELMIGLQESDVVRVKASR